MTAARPAASLIMKIDDQARGESHDREARNEAIAELPNARREACDAHDRRACSQADTDLLMTVTRPREPAMKPAASRHRSSF